MAFEVKTFDYAYGGHVTNNQKLGCPQWEDGFVIKNNCAVDDKCVLIDYGDIPELINALKKMYNHFLAKS